MSGKEDAMRKFIKKYVRENIEGVSVRQDHGNLYLVKGEAESYPCVVAHLDQVQTKHSRDFRVLEFDGRLFGFSAENSRQEGLGADDKNGIWVALKCLEMFDAIKVAFFKEEETGCGGSSIADLSFFDDCRYILQVDRRNGGDLITDIMGGLCSEDFLKDIAPIAKRWGYKETDGLMTDVETLEDRGVGISCINMSCGYYNPHTDSEYTVISELENCLGFVCDIIQNMTEVYPHKRSKSWGCYGYGKYYGGFGREWYDDDDDFAAYNRSFGVTSEENEEEEGAHGSYYDGVWLPDWWSYFDPTDAVLDFIRLNYYSDYAYEDLWYWIEEDATANGISYEDYMAAVDFYCEEEADDLPVAIAS